MITHLSFSLPCYIRTPFVHVFPVPGSYSGADPGGGPRGPGPPPDPRF